MKLSEFQGRTPAHGTVKFQNASGDSLWFEVDHEGDIEVTMELHQVGGQSFFLTRDQWKRMLEVVKP